MATSQERVEELLRLLEEEGSAQQPSSAQQQNEDRFQRAFEESPLGGAARRERTEELIRSHTEREPIVSHPGTGRFFAMQRGEELPPPPEEGIAPLVSDVIPETGTWLDTIGRGYIPEAFREEVDIPEEEERQDWRMVPRGLYRGVAQSAITMGQGLISIADMITNVAGFEDAIDPESMEFFQTLREASESVGHEEHWVGKLSEALGSMLTIAVPGFGQAGFTAKAVTSIAAGNAAKSTLGLAKFFQASKYAAAGGLGSGEANQLLEAHKEAGGDYTIGQRNLAIALGVPIGLSELVNIELFLKGFPRGMLPTKIAKNRFMSRVIELATTAGGEGLQEGLASIVQESSARMVYNPEQPIGDSFLSDFGYGAGAGAIFDILLRGFVGRRAGRPRSRTVEQVDKEHSETAPLQATDEELVDQRKREEPTVIYDANGEDVDADFMGSKDGVATFMLGNGDRVDVPMSGRVNSEGWSLWPDKDLVNSRYQVQTGQDEDGNPIHRDIGDLTDIELEEFTKGHNESVNESGATPEKAYESKALHNEMDRRGFNVESDDPTTGQDFDPLSNVDEAIDTADASVAGAKVGEKIAVFNFDGTKEEVTVNSLNDDGSIFEVSGADGASIPFDSRFTAKNIKNPHYRIEFPELEFTNKKINDFTNEEIHEAKNQLDGIKAENPFPEGSPFNLSLEQDLNAINYEIHRRNSESAVDNIDADAGRDTPSKVVNSGEEDIIGNNQEIDEITEIIQGGELNPERLSAAQKRISRLQRFTAATQSVLNDLNQNPNRLENITQEEFGRLVAAKAEQLKKTQESNDAASRGDQTTAERTGREAAKAQESAAKTEEGIDSSGNVPVTEGGVEQETTETSFIIPYTARGNLSAPDADSDIAYRSATARGANKPSEEDQQSIATKLGITIKEFKAQAKQYADQVRDLARKDVGSQEGVKSSWPAFTIQPFSEFVGKESEGVNRSAIYQRKKDLSIDTSTFKRLVKEASGSTRQPRNTKETDGLIEVMDRDQRGSLIASMEDSVVKKEAQGRTTDTISLNVDSNGNFIFTINDQEGKQVFEGQSREAGAESVLSNLEGRYNLSETNLNEIRDDLARRTDLSRIELDADLAGARVNYGNYELQFDSDIDKALYIIADGKKKSTRDSDYLNFLTRAYEAAGKPKTTAQLRSLGKKIKNNVIKPLVSKAGTSASINIPTWSQSLNIGISARNRGRTPLRRMIPGTRDQLFESVEDVAPADIEKILEIIKRVAPNADTTVSTEIYDDEGNRILGAQVKNIISVSTTGDYHADIENRAYHEATHYLLTNKYFTPEQEAFIRSEENLNELRSIVRNILGDQGYLAGVPDPSQGAQGKEGEVQELLAYASGYYNSAMEKTGKPPTEFQKGKIQEILDAIYKLFKQISDFLVGPTPSPIDMQDVFDQIRLGGIGKQFPSSLDTVGYKAGLTPSYMVRGGNPIARRSESAYVTSILDDYFYDKGTSVPKRAKGSEWLRPLDKGGWAGILRPNGNAKVTIKGKQFSVKLAELRASGLVDYLNSHSDEVVTKDQIRGFLDTQRRLLKLEVWESNDLDYDANEELVKNKIALMEDDISYAHEKLGAFIVSVNPSFAAWVIALPRLKAMSSVQGNPDLESEAAKSWPKDIINLIDKHGTEIDGYKDITSDDVFKLIGNPENSISLEELGDRIGYRKFFRSPTFRGTSKRIMSFWSDQRREAMPEAVPRAAGSFRSFRGINKSFFQYKSISEDIRNLEESKEFITREYKQVKDVGEATKNEDLIKAAMTNVADPIRKDRLARYARWTVLGHRDKYPKNYREIVLSMPATEGDLDNQEIYTTAHYGDVANPVVHFRLSDSFTEDGNKHLVIEEIQSDLNQEAFDYALNIKSIDMWNSDFNDLTRSQKNEVRNSITKEDIDTAYEEMGLPDVPFRTRNEYTNLAVSHIARIASNEGYSGIAIAGSDLQLERYGNMFKNRIGGMVVENTLILDDLIDSGWNRDQEYIDGILKKYIKDIEAGRTFDEEYDFRFSIDPVALKESFGSSADDLIADSIDYETGSSEHSKGYKFINIPLMLSGMKGLGAYPTLDPTGGLETETYKNRNRSTYNRIINEEISEYLHSLYKSLSNAYTVSYSSPLPDGSMGTSEGTENLAFRRKVGAVKSERFHDPSTGNNRRISPLTFEKWIGSDVAPLIEDELNQLNLKGRAVFSTEDVQSFISEKVKELESLSNEIDSGENVTQENILRLKSAYTDPVRNSIKNDGSVGLPVGEQAFKSYYDHLIPNSIMNTLTLGLSKTDAKKYKGEKKFLWIKDTDSKLDLVQSGAISEENLVNFLREDVQIIDQSDLAGMGRPKIPVSEELQEDTGISGLGIEDITVGGMQNAMRYFPIDPSMELGGNYSLKDPQPLWKMAADISSGKDERDNLSNNQTQTMGEWVISNVLNPLKGLPDQPLYKLARGKMLGLIHKTQLVTESIARDLAPYLDESNPKKRADHKELRVALYRYLTTAPADGEADMHQRLKAIDPKVAAAAVRAKNIIEAIGKELVQRGVMAPDVFYANRRSYLPRLYLKHVISNPSGSVADYLQKRDPDLTEQARDISGEIAELAPEFLVSRAIQRPMRDLAMMEFFDSVSRHDPWVVKDDEILVDWIDESTGKTRKVSAFWMVHQANQIRKVAEYRKHGDRKKFDELNAKADKMLKDAAPIIAKYAKRRGLAPVLGKDGLVDPKKVAEIELDPSDAVKGYKRVPNNPVKYGMLSGMSVAKPIYDDVITAMSYIGWGDTAYVRLAGVGRKLTAAWKTLKVPLNPPTVFRNMMSNMMLMHLSGVPMRRIVPNMVLSMREAIAYKNGDMEGSKHYRAMMERGVADASFSAAELYTLSSDTERLLKGVSIEDGGFINWLNMKTWKRLSSLGGKFYQSIEVIGKTAVAIEMMEHQGKNADDAFLIANDALFDYSLVHPVVRGWRTSPVGIPFLTFYYKVFPLLAKTALDNPLRFSPYVALMIALPELFKTVYGIDDDEYETVKQLLPDFARDPTATFPLPYRDSKGNIQMIDLGYIVPWGALTSLSLQGVKGVKQIAGVTQIDGIDIGDITRTLGLFGGPAWAAGAGFFNYDTFTGRPIVDRSQPAFVGGAEESILRGRGQIPDALLWVANQYMLPGFLHTNYGAVSRIFDAVNERTRPSGLEGISIEQAILKMIGLNLYSVNPRQLEATLKYYEGEEAKFQTGLNNLLRDRSLSREEILRRRVSWDNALRANRDRMDLIRSSTRLTPNLVGVLKNHEERMRDLQK